MQIKIRHALCICAILASLSLVMAGTAFAEYIHGYFSYEVEDGSVVITGYSGPDEVVTVPAVIAGNPVNIIGSDAFITNPNVKVVCVHTSVVQVRQGALAPGQKLQFIDNDGNPINIGDINGRKADAGDDGSQIEDAAQEEKEGQAAEGQQAAEGDAAASQIVPGTPTGIRLKGGSFVTLDSDGNLVVADIKGNERVLDDTQTYTRETTEDGSVVFRDATGRTVEIDPEASTVSYVHSDGMQMTFNSLQSVTQITDKDGNTFTVESEFMEDDFNSGEQDKSQSKTEEDAKENSSAPQTSIAFIIVVAACTLVTGVYCLRRIYHKQQATTPV